MIARSPGLTCALRTGLALGCVALLGCTSDPPAEETSGGSSQSGGSAPGGSGGVSGGGGSSGSASGGLSSAGASASGGSTSSGGMAGAPVQATEPPFDWVGIIGTGQSLSNGADSVAISTTQPFNNLMLRDDGPDPKYPIDGSESAVWSVVPLTEPHRPNITHSMDNYPYPNNILGKGELFGETPHSGMANTISTAWVARNPGGDYVTVHSVVGMGGQCLIGLEKAAGATSYEPALSEARVFQKLASAQGKSYGVGGIVLTHGECDTSTGTADYGERVVKLWQDYNTDLRAITGQDRDIVLLASQQSAVTTSDAEAYDTPAVQLWRASHEHPDQVIVTEAKYAYGPYWLHMPAPSYERVGEKYGEVFDLVFNQAVVWKPVGPKAVSRSGTLITVELDVPNPPLVWDDDLARPHQSKHTAWANGRGFEVKDQQGNELSIANVEISGESVLVTLNSDPAGPVVLGYALTADADPGSWGGTDLGPHGQLRDSDSFEGYAAEAIDVLLTNGSNQVSASEGAFLRRAWLDIVSGTGLAEDTKLLSFNSDSSITLSKPWSGASGTAPLKFHHNHYNYAVHFAWQVE
ncbi:MAG TPA: dockerin [Polyangiaceae bacterium]|nr:dockerin [Polyangiaceae bacterium]